MTTDETLYTLTPAGEDYAQRLREQDKATRDRLDAAEATVRALRRLLAGLVDEYVVVPAAGEPYVYHGHYVTEYKQRLWDDAREALA